MGRMEISFLKDLHAMPHTLDATLVWINYPRHSFGRTASIFTHLKQLLFWWLPAKWRIYTSIVVFFVQQKRTPCHRFPMLYVVTSFRECSKTVVGTSRMVSFINSNVVHLPLPREASEERKWWYDGGWPGFLEDTVCTFNDRADAQYPFTLLTSANYKSCLEWRKILLTVHRSRFIAVTYECTFPRDRHFVGNTEITGMTYSYTCINEITFR